MNPAQSDFVEDQRQPLHHILLRSAWLADDVMRELQLGASFEELATEYSACLSASKQGFVGLHNIEQLPEAIRFALLTDRGQQQYIGPVKTRYGFHIIKSGYIAPSASSDHHQQEDDADKSAIATNSAPEEELSNDDLDADLSDEKSANRPTNKS